MSTTTIKLIHTNDLHGTIDHFGKMAAYIDREREKNEYVLYLDAGDISSGHPIVDWKNGKPIVELLNRIGLQAMTIGNHDFDYGQASFEINREHSLFPWLGANIKVNQEETLIKQPEPYHIFNIGSMRIGVVSVIESPPATPSEYVKGLEFGNPIEALKHYLYLKEETDLLIALTHVGHHLDYKIAQEVVGYDVIIGGHSHTVVDSEWVNGTLVVNTGAYAEIIGEITITYNHATQSVEHIDSVLVPINKLIEVNEEIQAVVDHYFVEMQDVLGKVVGETTGLSLDHMFEQDTPLGNFWTDAIKKATGATIALANNGGMRCPLLPGPITAEHIYKTAPFQNQLVILDMTGFAIREVIRYSFTRANRIDLQTSGLTYVVLQDEEDNFIDCELFFQGERLDLEKTYTVVTTDYLAYRGDGYPFEGKIINHKAGEMANTLIQFAHHCMEKDGIIHYTNEQRITKKYIMHHVKEMPKSKEPYVQNYHRNVHLSMSTERDGAAVKLKGCR